MDRPLKWQIATVRAIRPETFNVKTFTLALPHWHPHCAGQHYDVRLTAPDGYQAQRSYSIASEPERVGEIDLTVERIAGGEVSPYLHGILTVGDLIEVRGPIGGYFVWRVQMGGPLLLIGGGSGIVPLMAIIRHRAAAESGVCTKLLYSVRSPEDMIYRKELDRRRLSDKDLDIFYTFTRRTPPGWSGYARRIDTQILEDVIRLPDRAPQTYICGPTPFVEAVASGLVEIGVAPARIRTERFGPTGPTP